MALYTESYTLFSSLQRIFASSMRLPNGGAWEKQNLEALIGPPGAETVGHMRRLGMMYLDELSRLREANDVDVSLLCPCLPGILISSPACEVILQPYITSFSSLSSSTSRLMGVEKASLARSC